MSIGKHAVTDHPLPSADMRVLPVASMQGNTFTLPASCNPAIFTDQYIHSPFQSGPPHKVPAKGSLVPRMAVTVFVAPRDLELVSLGSPSCEVTCLFRTGHPIMQELPCLWPVLDNEKPGVPTCTFDELVEH
jgi:hypothetical protein